MFDLIVILLVLACVVAGYLRGVLLDALAFAALLIAWTASARLGPGLGQALVGGPDTSALRGYLVGRIVAGLLIYASLRICASLVSRKFGRTRRGITHGWNRKLGALSGFLFGALLALAVLLGADTLLKVYPDASGAVAASARSSRLRRLVSAHNPADRYLLTDALRLLRVAAQNPEVLSELGTEERIQQVLNQPDIRSVMQDEELQKAVRRGDLDAVLNNPNLRRLLESKEARQSIFSPETRAALDELLRQAEAEAGRGAPGERR